MPHTTPPTAPLTATPLTLSTLEAAIRASWAEDTSEPSDLTRIPWTPDNPAWGHCDITALVAHDFLGGELMRGEVYGASGRQEGYHWWNRLPGGLELDLTREQFQHGERVTGGEPVPRPTAHPFRRAETYDVLRARVLTRLAGRPGVSAAGRSR
ncbi:hypothetical protein JJV70_20285 [Streptomyces sp. JJ66]|uniref:YunG family protein n=1 Tax=Streptomyces sp. JJ66 TaxID=2803843 RepID=UPI001C568E87|nr:hypothetical protein [Streptomyces sp. JJ66]MBW1604398.1 hypothetical protein [Streptomyces sp. JJ66]